MILDARLRGHDEFKAMGSYLKAKRLSLRLT